MDWRRNISRLLLAAAPVTATPALAAAEVADILKQMTGCFRVTFNFVEDGDHDAFYEPTLEKAVLTAESPLTITRYLVVGGREQLHWSEVWTQVEGREWRQRVTGPAGDFRYECDGEWVLNQWSCQAPGAAKPRRDAARPYAKLDRTNILQVNAKRWIHSQLNRKVTDAGDVYSVEAGWNAYEKAADADCTTTPL